ARVIPRGGRRIGRRGLRVFGGACAALAGLGALVEAVAADRDRRAFPPPGRLIDVGGNRLHLHILGEPRDRPTIILEAGLDSFSTNWYWVQADLASSMRVVAYDRAGLGWCGIGAGPREARQSGAELHAALPASGTKGIGRAH